MFIKLLRENNAENLSQQLALEQISADGTGGLVSLLRLNELLEKVLENPKINEKEVLLDLAREMF